MVRPAPHTPTSTSQLPDQRDSVLLVANYRPDVGFAWWLMENFWSEFSYVAAQHGLRTILAYPTGGPIPERIAAAPLAVVVQPFASGGARGLLQWVSFVRRHRVRCIYFTDRSFTRLAYALFRLVGVKLLINHDHTPGDRPPIRGVKGMLKRVWRRLPMTSCDLQLCVSPLVGERATLNAGIPESKVRVVQNGIKPFAGDSPRGYINEALSIPRAAVICITVCRAHPYKRVDFAVRTAAHYLRSRPSSNACFVHCGDGPALDELAELASELGVAERFRFAGRRSDVEPLLRSSDLAFHPAKGEAFSLAILEYMSAGLPVVVPDVPSVSQAIRSRETGFIYEDGDLDAARDALANLIEDAELRRRLGAAAADDVRERYSLDMTNANFRQVISTALHEL